MARIGGLSKGSLGDRKGALGACRKSSKAEAEAHEESAA